jgi:hypothetical protein
MSFRPASAAEIKIWGKWLRKSHGIQKLPGASVYHCDLDYPMLLTPIKVFQDFAMHVERDSDQPVMTFRLHEDVRTIAAFWALPEAPRMAFSGLDQVNLVRTSLIDSAKEGRVWWGIEYPPESTITTSLICWFPKTLPLPSEIKHGLRLEPSIMPMASSLNLV